MLDQLLRLVLDLPRKHLQSAVRIPDFTVPEGRWIDLPRRGRTWLTDVPGPTPEAPVIVLLHAVGCTALLTWFPVIEQLRKRYRVVLFDQRWHGRGIVSDHFALADCADDVAAVIVELGLSRPIVAGYSMGSIVAQRVWRQHPDLVGGLILCATTDHFRNNGRERVFHSYMELSMGALHALAKNKTVQRASLRTFEAMIDVKATDTHQWALEQWRATSPWAIGQAVASLGRFRSTFWLPMVDVPTAVVIPRNDKVIPPERQRRVASLIPERTVHEAEMGHAGCVMEAAEFVPVFMEAVNTTQARVNDRQRIAAAYNA